jgi:hypothetical protein
MTPDSRARIAIVVLESKHYFLYTEFLVPFFSFFEILLGESLYLFTLQLFFLKEMGVVVDLKNYWLK